MLRRLIATALVMTLATTASAQSPAIIGPDVWRTFAERLPAAAQIRVRLQTGERFTATLIETGEEGLLLQPRTRLPVPPQRVAYATIASMEQVERGNAAGIGKAIAIGAASGAAVFLGLLMIALSTWD